MYELVSVAAVRGFRCIVTVYHHTSPCIVGSGVRFDEKRQPSDCFVAV